MSALMTIDEIKSRLGGEERLAEVGAHDFSIEPSHVTFRLSRRNPNGVRTVELTVEPNGLYAMDCFGRLLPGAFKAEHVASARQILPENLATVLGQATGIDSLHHRHF